MKPRALITGISGQDGSYLAEYLSQAGYDVFGILRRQSVSENQDQRIAHLPNITNFYGDLTDYPSLNRIIHEVKPDIIYNIGAMSHVRISFDIPAFTIQTNTVGVLNLLEIIRLDFPNTKLYQASSSEMFGNSIDQDGFQRETTPMVPVSPYGCAKLMAYNLIRHYRAAYGLFCCNGILFNHESPRRGSNFVTQKVIKTAVEIKLGLAKELVLGNIDSQRDWGHAKDYIRGMKMIMDHHKPDDFVIATGNTHSVRDLCELVFRKLDLNYLNFVKFDQKYTRPEELNILRGSAEKARRELGWYPAYTYEELIDEMIGNWMEKLS